MSNLVFDFCSSQRTFEEIPPDDPVVTSMNGWDFAAKPKIPFRRVFKGTLYGMVWCLTSTGQLYSTELIPNVGFDDPTGWTLTGFTISNGLLNATLVSGNSATANFISGVTLSDVLELVINVKDAGSGNLQVKVGTTSSSGAWLAGQTLVLGENRILVTVGATTAQASTLITFTNSGTPTKVAQVESVTMRRRSGTTTLYTPLDPLTLPQRNVARALEFYQLHRLWDSFQIKHEYLGLIRVRFSKPLRIIAAHPDSGGLCDPVEIELVEHSPVYT